MQGWACDTILNLKQALVKRHKDRYSPGLKFILRMKPGQDLQYEIRSIISESSAVKSAERRPEVNGSSTSPA